MDIGPVEYSTMTQPTVDWQHSRSFGQVRQKLPCEGVSSDVVMDVHNLLCDVTVEISGQSPQALHSTRPLQSGCRYLPH